MVGKPVNPKCGLLVECVGNRHDDTGLTLRVTATTTDVINEEAAVDLTVRKEAS